MSTVQQMLHWFLCRFGRRAVKQLRFEMNAGVDARLTRFNIRRIARRKGLGSDLRLTNSECAHIFHEHTHCLDYDFQEGFKTKD